MTTHPGTGVQRRMESIITCSERNRGASLQRAVIFVHLLFFPKGLFSHIARKEARPYIIRNSISEHPRENQTGLGFKYQKEDSVSLLNSEFGEQKEGISASAVQTGRKKEICNLKLIYISIVNAN